jgi:hypothetical protein
MTALGGIALASVLPKSSINAAEPRGAALAERPEIAAGRFGQMSCAEALATAYGDLAGLQPEQARNLAGGFGLGMGRKNTCGAVTVMLMIAGLSGKKDACRALMDAFERETGSIRCADYVDQHGYSKCRDLLRCAGRQLNEQVFA